VNRRILLAILVFSAAVRAAYFLAGQDDAYFILPIHDAQRYHEWASAISEGRSFESGPYYQAPLYPWLVGATYRIAGPHPEVAFVLQLALGVLTLGLVARIASRAYGPRAGLMAAAAGALLHVLVFYETKLLGTSLAVFVAAWAVDRLQLADQSGRAVDWAIAGIVLGLGSLVHPGFLLLVATCGLWIVFDRGRAPGILKTRLITLAVGAAVVIAPVTIRNVAVSGHWVLISTNGGITFAQGNAPGASGSFTHLPGLSGSIRTQREQTRALAEEAEGQPLSDPEVSRWWFRRGLRWIANSPGAWIKLELRKLGMALASKDQPLEYDPGLDTNPVRRLLFVPFGLLLGLAAARVAAGGARTRAEAPLVLLLGSQLAMLLAFYVTGRYRLPLIPALLAVAGGGAAALSDRRVPSGRRIAAASLGLAVCTASLAYAPAFLGKLSAQQRSMSLDDRGRLLLYADRSDEAVETLRRSVSSDPAYAFARVDLSRALRKAGDRRGAEAAIREAIRLDPTMAEAHFDLGVLLFENGHLSEAATSFAEAWELEPDNALAANNLTGTFIKLGKYAEATAAYRRMIRQGIEPDPPIAQWMGQRGTTPR